MPFNQQRIENDKQVEVDSAKIIHIVHNKREEMNFK
jgi:hypothetical protein